jgi:hypothetical protein
MSSSQAMPKMDDNMGFNTPNFFNSAWNPEQSDFSFAENLNNNNGGYAGYSQNYSMGNVENEQIDYFSGHPSRGFLTSQQNQGSGPNQLDDDVGRILTPGLSFLSMVLDPETEKAFAQQPTSYSSMSQNKVNHDMMPYNRSLNFGNNVPQTLPLESWNSDMPTKLSANMIHNGTERLSALKHGQVTPGDSPPDDESNQVSTNDNKSMRGKRASIVSKPEAEAEALVKPAKKARKSKKKPITKEQEEAKRKKFLERNRVAADKCRQNRKKWVDDLQEKCHNYSADIALKKAALEDMEHEMMQLKSMLLVHAQTCKDNSILDWVNSRSNKTRPSAVGEEVIFAPEQLLDDSDSPESNEDDYEGTTATKCEL